MKSLFWNKTAVVTGGTSGIGRAVAQKLAGSGAAVIIAGQDESKGKTAETQLRENCSHDNITFIKANISSDQQVKSLFDQAAQLYGSVDLLFNNAGREGIMAPMTDLPAEVCDELTEVNIKGTFLCAKHALLHMLEQGEGVIVNNASFVGTTVPFPPGTMYGATKAAVLSMTSSLAEGYGEEEIRVMAVCPWMTDTPMVERLTGGDDEARANLQHINPSGSFARPEDIADVVVRMFAGEAAFGPGEAYLVDAGAMLQQVQIPYQAVG